MNRLLYDYNVPGFLSLSRSLHQAQHADPHHLARVQSQRLRRLYRHAVTRSAFYRCLYGGPEELDSGRFETLPPVTKAMVMDAFDDVVTDPQVTKQSVLDFVQDPATLGQPLNGKYFVARTSGTTGSVGHYVHDLFSYWLCNALTVIRSPGQAALRTACLHPMRGSIRRLRIASVLSPAANLGVASVMASSPSFVRLSADVRLFDILKPQQQMLSDLSTFDPDVLGSFPTVLNQLAEAQAAGRLQIAPRIIRSGGETLTERTRKALAEQFGCAVFDSYGCGECCWVGMECSEGDGIHVFSDWFILEPVDETGRSVPPGVESSKVYITNLANYIQPFIRFELPDRITQLMEPCRCGSPFPRIRIAGRASEVLFFVDNRGVEQTVPPFHLTTIAEMAPGIHQYQLVQETRGRLRVNFIARPGTDAKRLEEHLQRGYSDYLRQRNLDTTVDLCLSLVDAVQPDRSGKTKQVVCLVDRSIS